MVRFCVHRLGNLGVFLNTENVGLEKQPRDSEFCYCMPEELSDYKNYTNVFCVTPRAPRVDHQSSLTSCMHQTYFLFGLDTPTHYANMPMQYSAIFHGCKNGNFQMNFLIFFLFLLKT